MKVSELIELLLKADPDDEVQILFETDDEKARKRCQYQVTPTGAFRAKPGLFIIGHEWEEKGHYALERQK